MEQYVIAGLVRKRAALSGEIEETHERLHQMVVRVSVALQCDVFKIKRIVVEVGGFPGEDCCGQFASFIHALSKFEFFRALKSEVAGSVILVVGIGTARAEVCVV